MNLYTNLYTFIVPEDEERLQKLLQHLMYSVGGYTLGQASGGWLYDGTTYVEKNVTVSIACHEEIYRNVISYTLQLYNEACIMSWCASTSVRFDYK